MGYDVHIHRADNWTESQAKRISLLEWHVYLDTDPDLEITYVPEHVIAKMRRIAGYFRARVQGDDGEFYE